MRRMDVEFSTIAMERLTPKAYKAPNEILIDWKNFYECQLCKKYSMKSYSVMPFWEHEHFCWFFLLQIATDNMVIMYVENSLILSHSVKIKEKNDDWEKNLFENLVEKFFQNQVPHSQEPSSVQRVIWSRSWFLWTSSAFHTEIMNF